MANVKQELSQLGMTEEKGSDDRSRLTIQDLKEGEKEGRTRVKSWDLQARATLRQSFQDDK